MRFVRFGDLGNEHPGVFDADGRIRDLSAIIPDISGSILGNHTLDRLRLLNVAELPLVPSNSRLGACVAGVPNLIGVGLNYRDHAEETNNRFPGQPVLFNKHTSSIAGPNDDVILPPHAEKLDWEVELGIVIGRTCWHVDERHSLDYVAGYCLANDVSERAYQLEMEGQWTKGKSHKGFAPLGPWLVTPDEIPDPQAIELSLDVNGIQRQRGNTRNMIFGIKTLIAYISRFMSMMPGDVIITGTPAGVGLAQKPPTFLKSGDEIRLSGAGLGTQCQRVVPYSESMRQP